MNRGFKLIEHCQSQHQIPICYVCKLCMGYLHLNEEIIAQFAGVPSVRASWCGAS